MQAYRQLLQDNGIRIPFSLMLNPLLDEFKGAGDKGQKLGVVRAGAAING
jgi:hypothetical protein